MATTKLTFYPPYPFELDHTSINSYVQTKGYNPKSIFFDKYAENINVILEEKLTTTDEEAFKAVYKNDAEPRVETSLV